MCEMCFRKRFCGQKNPKYVCGIAVLPMVENTSKLLPPTQAIQPAEVFIYFTIHIDICKTNSPSNYYSKSCSINNSNSPCCLSCGTNQLWSRKWPGSRTHWEFTSRRRGRNSIHDRRGNWFRTSRWSLFPSTIPNWRFFPHMAAFLLCPFYI